MSKDTWMINSPKITLLKLLWIHLSGCSWLVSNKKHPHNAKLTFSFYILWIFCFCFTCFYVALIKSSAKWMKSINNLNDRLSDRRTASPSGFTSVSSSSLYYTQGIFYCCNGKEFRVFLMNRLLHLVQETVI